MIAHLVVPTSSYEKNAEKYKRILLTIQSLGYRPTRSATTDQSTLIEMGLGILDQEECEILCKRDLEMLAASDVVIADTTDRATFGVGYQAAVALAAGKPTLLLEVEGATKGSFISGLKHPSLTRAFYAESTLSEAVEKFLRTVAIK